MSRKLNILALLGALLWAAAWVSPARAESPAPASVSGAAPAAPASPAAASAAANERAAVAPAGPYEDQPIVRPSGKTAASTGQSRSTGRPQDIMGWGRMLLALAVVLTLILMLKPALRRMAGGGAGARSTRAVQVLSTQMIAPRQHLVLVRIGRRLVLIGNSGTAMNALCEISEPDEVAALLGQLSSEKTGPASRTFGAMLRRAGRPAESVADSRPPVETAGLTSDGLDDEPIPPAQGAEPSRFVNRDELSGLIEKVRTLSQQFER